MNYELVKEDLPQTAEELVEAANFDDAAIARAIEIARDEDRALEEELEKSEQGLGPSDQ